MVEHKNHNCVRCKIPLEATWGHAQCGLCKRELAAMHAASEYVMFGKAYYIPCTEGASLEWLLNNGYKKDIVLPQSVRTTSKDQAVGAEVKVLANTT